uniref:uncharacterized protein K02A2.6-like n=1 Tax=Styela clava TaxID=7725 RepID=UPI001939E705|nr:uncharacterized protein K02A2.6-like [Styela clava]
MVRDKFVLGLSDNSVKERLLREKDPTITKALEIARTVETSKAQIDAMKNTSNACDTNMFKKEENSEINNLQKSRNIKKQTQKSRSYGKRTCQYCGRFHAPRSCSAFGKRCNYCKKIGHFESVCRLKSRRPGGNKDVCTLQRHAKTNNADNSEDRTPTLYCLNDVNSLNDKDSWHVDVKILDKSVNFKIDTGADCNVISERIFDQLKVKNLKIHPTSIILKMFDGRKIKPKCKICVPCEHKGFPKHIDIMIVKQDVPSVLGLNACISLNLIKRIDNLQNCNNVEDAFSNIFDGLGVIDNFVHKIQLKTDVKAIINPPRRVPVALRELLKAELNRLEDLNVIEKITEPTEWVNSLVIVKKKNNALRICLDPLHLNRAIKREHFPMQTIEDIMTRMSNAKYLSVLDANHGFWQIKLDDDSAKLCTFNTIFGRYFFKRLPMGISSTSEVFQRIMTQIFENIEGVEVIIDDILVWGSTLEEHDQRLSIVLEKIRQSNLKLNRDKCKFRLARQHMTV